ncbi:histidine phosphatase family protein [Brevibacillus sp. NRS-1366]|uniref:histidine phosphatase family protein n=1 Tax=Brevibacillus sp. NRS-1366 TaxID=3233899 RepID=UPI003D2166C2
MNWIWIRHGVTDINRQGRYLGHSDISLNEEGRSQAKELTYRLKSLVDRPAALYSSDLLRCVETAEPLSTEWQLPVLALPALRELSFGEWELLTYDEIMQTDSERAIRWYDDPYRQRPPQGESLEELGRRVDGWLCSLLAKSEQDLADTVIVVTHGGVIRWVQAVWLQNDPSAYWTVDGLKHGEALFTNWNGRRLTHATAKE